MSQANQDQTFLSGVNAEYIAHLYTQYLRNPNNVDQSWKGFFGELDDSEAAFLKELGGASWTPDENAKDKRSFGSAAIAPADGLIADAEAANDRRKNKGGSASAADVQKAAKDSIRALMLIRAYRFRGHYLANLDPLDMKQVGDHPELHPEHYGFTDGDYDHKIFLNGMLGLEYASLREIAAVLKEVYSGTIGICSRGSSRALSRLCS